MEDMGLKFTPVSDGETSLRPSEHIWAYGWNLFDS